MFMRVDSSLDFNRFMAASFTLRISVKIFSFFNHKIMFFTETDLRYDEIPH